MSVQGNRIFDQGSQVDFPFRIDWDGRSRLTGYEDHVRDLIEQVLFTAPGERVNRPGFGSGLYQLTFDPNGEFTAETVRMTAEAALQQWLGHLIEVTELKVEAEDSLLTVNISYLLRKTRERGTAHLERAY